MNKQAVNVWQAAAAVLIEHGGEMHYEEISKRIERSGLTTLALKGSTPAQTVGAQLRHHSAIFDHGDERGYYCVRNVEHARRNGGVQIALAQLASAISDAAKAERMQRLDKEIDRLRKANRSLRKTLQRINSICEDELGSAEVEPDAPDTQ